MRPPGKKGTAGASKISLGEKTAHLCGPLAPDLLVIWGWETCSGRAARLYWLSVAADIVYIALVGMIMAGKVAVAPLRPRGPGYFSCNPFARLSLQG